MGQKFRHQVVVVTGASSGIGLATSHAFAREGARLVMGSRRKEELEIVVAKLRRGGREARPVPCDVTLPADVARLVNAGLERWDRVDVLVANAGIGMVGELSEVAPDDVRRVFETNVMGVLNSIHAVLPHMKARGRGTIVVVSSVMGFRGVPRFSAYCATKAALNSLAESLMVELAPHGIHVVLCCPGLTDTPFMTNRLGVKGNEHLRDHVRAMPAEDVADAIVSAVHRRKRRVTLTWSGHALGYMSRFSPRLSDLVARIWHARTTGLVPKEPAPASAPPADSPETPRST